MNPPTLNPGTEVHTCIVKPANTLSVRTIVQTHCIVHHAGTSIFNLVQTTQPHQSHSCKPFKHAFSCEYSVLAFRIQTSLSCVPCHWVSTRTPPSMIRIQSLLSNPSDPARAFCYTGVGRNDLQNACLESEMYSGSGLITFPKGVYSQKKTLSTVVSVRSSSFPVRNNSYAILAMCCEECISFI